MHHARLGYFGFDVVPSWVNCKERYIDETWRDNERDEESHARILTRSWTKVPSTHSSKRKGYLFLNNQEKTKTIENVATLSHVQMKRTHQEYIHHPVVEKLDMDTIVIQYMLAVSCWVVSWVVLATSLIWARLVVIKCEVMSKPKRRTYDVEDSHQLKSHRKLNNHEGSPRVTRVKNHSWLYIPPHCMRKWIFTLDPPT